MFVHVYLDFFSSYVHLSLSFNNRSLQVTDIACFRVRWICNDLSILYINSVLLRSNLGKLQIPSNNISFHFKTKHLFKGTDNDYYIDYAYYI